MRWLMTVYGATSPSTSLRPNVGTGSHEGRWSARPSAFAKSRIRTGSGAPAFTGPETLSFSSACTYRPTMSSTWTQLNHCLPLPTGPPTKKRIGVTTLGRKPSRPSTMPVRSVTRRQPLAATFSASRCHATARSARKSPPVSASSVRTASPLSP